MAGPQLWPFERDAVAVEVIARLIASAEGGRRWHAGSAREALMRDERRYVRSGAIQGLQEPIAKEHAQAERQRPPPAKRRGRCAFSLRSRQLERESLAPRSARRRPAR
jgi:hypothetical protein